jgi:hypothetical protein
MHTLPLLTEGPGSTGRCERHGSGLGMAWGLDVDERGTTRPYGGGEAKLGMTGELVPRPNGTAIRPVSSADTTPSTCPQDRRR